MLLLFNQSLKTTQVNPTRWSFWPFSTNGIKWSCHILSLRRTPHDLTKEQRCWAVWPKAGYGWPRKLRRRRSKSLLAGARDVWFRFRFGWFYLDGFGWFGFGMVLVLRLDSLGWFLSGVVNSLQEVYGDLVNNSFNCGDLSDWACYFTTFGCCCPFCARNHGIVLWTPNDH